MDIICGNYVFNELFLYNLLLPFGVKFDII